MISNQSTFAFWVKWLSTIAACGCALASALEMFPLNVWLGAVAGIGWIYIGSLWREPSVIIINVMMAVLYGYGVVRTFI